MKMQQLFAGAALALLPVFAFAITVPVQLDNPAADFSNAIGGTNVNYSNGSPHSEVRWGTPQQQQQSGLGFTVFTSPLNTSTGTTFNLGELFHYNWPINAGTAATGVDLNFSFNITDPALGPVNFLFTLAIDETPNQLPCSYPSTTPCADKITFNSSTSTATFNIGTDKYTLYLMGFGDDADHITDRFITQEGGVNHTYLWAKIDLYQPPVGVPEPTVLLMMALGLLGIGGATAARRRKLRDGSEA
jgi:hypothetical protein